ncbi:MAG: hypothetical protein ACE15C_04465 [Phycisphaerae bacterium]
MKRIIFRCVETHIMLWASVWAGLCIVLALSSFAWSQSLRPASAPSAEIAGLIAQLGDTRWTVREAATAKLRSANDPAVIPALRKAAESEDLEVSIRAKLLLAELLNFSHVVVDALGQPIAGASLTILHDNDPSRTKPLAVKTSTFGGATLPSDWVEEAARLRVAHPEYGQAEGFASIARPEGDKGPVFTQFRVPLVQKDSAAFARALKGTVLGPDDKPVEGARIHCTVVRTPGEGLIQYHNRLPDVLTDAEGKFAIYVPDPNPRNERGKLIPPSLATRSA